MKATLLDTLHGTRHTVSGHHSVKWVEGHLAHDRHRRALLAIPDDQGPPFRFIVVAAEFEPDEPEFTLWRLNSLVPWSVLKRHEFPGSAGDRLTGWDEAPPRPSWREPDARDLIAPLEAQRLLRLWEVTGHNFVWQRVCDILAEIGDTSFKRADELWTLAQDLGESRIQQEAWNLQEALKKEGEARLNRQLNALREEWDAEDERKRAKSG